MKFLSKLVEKTVVVQLNDYLMVNGLHKSFQSAYKAHHSTETALLTITDNILLSLDRGDNVFLLLLDLSAAFDTVNNSLLLSRLENLFGITGTVLHLLYTAPFAEIIRSHGLVYHFYADDTQLYISFKDCDVDVTRLHVENCVADICHWMDVNRNYAYLLEVPYSSTLQLLQYR